MKYHQKLNLRSPVYKHVQASKSPSRSPKNSNNKQFLNAAELFQKVCCPNCKYAFKIIKSQNLIQNKKKDGHVSNPLKKMLNKQIQATQQYSNFSEFSNSIQKVYNKQKSFQINSKLELSRRNQISRISQILGNQNINTSHLKQSDYKFKPLSLTPKNLKSKSIQLIKTLQNSNLSPFKRVKKNQYTQNIVQPQEKKKQAIPSPKKESFLISPQTPNKNTTKLQTSKIQKEKKMIQKQQKESKQVNNLKNNHVQQNIEKKQPQKSVRNLKNQAALINEIVKKIQNQNVMNQLINLCEQLKTQNQIPAYCKMLLYEGKIQ